MLQHIPKIVTIAAGEEQASHSSEPALCHDELLSLINELADLHLGNVRFVLRDQAVFDSLSLAAAHAIRRGLPTTISLGVFDDDILMQTIDLRPMAIAMPLHGPELGAGWRISMRAIQAIAGSGVAAEVESRITRANAGGLLPLWAAASIAGATRWRIDCGLETLPASLTASVASAILDVAGSDEVSIIVHELPVLRSVLLQEMVGREGGVPDLRRLTLLDARDTLFISPRGDVLPSEWSRVPLGNVRIESIEQILAPQARRNAFSTAMALG